MLTGLEDSLAVLQLSSPLIALLSVIMFEVPRYLFSSCAMAFFHDETEHQIDLSTSISIIISSYNGAHTLVKTVKSAHAQKGNIVEIIIIDDGSDDDTLQCAHQLKRDGYATKIIHHAHRIGKSAANNHAARFAKGDLLLSLDDDTHLSTPYEAAHLASAFADKNVAAASGNLKIANSSASLWTSLQSLEYLASITAGRSFLNIIDAIACCSGAFSMFDRTIFLKIGGLNVGPGEDLEITQRLRLLGYTTRFVRHAEAMTQAPVTLARLIHQRVRWDRDALNIRLLMYKQLMAQSTHESLGDTLQRLDFVIFELVPTFFFPFYCIYIIYFFQSEALNFLYGLYILLLGLYTLNIAIVIITTRAQLAFFDALTIFILPLYQGVFMRFVRIYAFADELFFQGSHRDTYVPKYIRTALYQKVNYAQD